MSEPRPILAVSELSVTRHGAAELDKLSFTLDSGETLVLLGDAASGKDALLRVLGGYTTRGEALLGTIRYGDAAARPAAERPKPPIRVVYLSGAAGTALNPHASVLSQLERIVANALTVRRPSQNCRKSPANWTR
jgi:ABC-type transport system involved in cytochrome c biogenesis ATPase subunit